MQLKSGDSLYASFILCTFNTAFNLETNTFCVNFLFCILSVINTVF